jgi:hypothetical protein
VDERFQRVLRDARAGNTAAALQLAHELRRAGIIPPPGDLYTSKPISLFPFPSYRIEMLPRGAQPEGGADHYVFVDPGAFRNTTLQFEPFDVCVIPVTDSLVNMVIGRPYGRSVEFQEGVFTGELRFPSSLRAELLGERSPWAMPLHGNPFIYYRLCRSMRGPIYATPGGKLYELSANTTLIPAPQEHFRFRTWDGGLLRFHFDTDRPRPRGYQQIAYRARILTPSILRAVNEFLRSHPEVFDLPGHAANVSDLSQSIQEMERAEERLAILQNKVAGLALDVADHLGL